MNFIELLTGLAPDSGNGSCEIALIAIGVFAIVLARRALQRLRA